MPPENEQLDAELDALHILPLCILPLKHKVLKRKRLIMNTRMEGIVEIFADPASGSGQIYPSELATTYEFTQDEIEDIKIVQKLSKLPSYDVYSLRIRLREMGIAVDEIDHLKLSAEKENELSTYMAQFTRPLMKAVYGDNAAKDQDFRKILDGLSTPDIDTALANLEKISNALNISRNEIPRFLERYGDIYLSLSYYQQVLDRNIIALNEFLEEMGEVLSAAKQRPNQKGLRETCAMVRWVLVDIVTEVGTLLDLFKSRTSRMWDDISPQQFGEIADLVTSYHARVSAALCLIDVKMRSWAEKFPYPEAGSTQQRANFILSDMKPGLENHVAVDEPA